MKKNTKEEARRAVLEVFDNSYPEREYMIKHVCPEFTSVCPKTGQPDYGTINIEYIPSEKCIELKSLKMYLQQYRNEGIFYENLANMILDDLVAVLKPHYMSISAEFTPRGGIHSIITAEYADEEEGECCSCGECH